MRKHIALSVLSMLAAFTATTPPVHAGGGMGPGSGVTTCRVVSGAPKQYQVIGIIDDFTVAPTPGDQMNVGTLTLLCDLGAIGQTLNPAVGTTGTGDAILPTDPTPEGFTRGVSCYSVGKADKTAAPVTVEDAFSRTFVQHGTYDVVVGAINVVCVPAFFKDNTPAP